MKKTRQKTFETNSSSTHSLTQIGREIDYFLPKGDKIVVFFADTNDDVSYVTLKEKVSYLVGHIINSYKYNVYDYEDLVKQVEKDYNFIELNKYVKERYGKEIVLPKKYDGEIEDIVNINHQLVTSSFDDLLEDIINENRNYFAEILENGKRIDIGHD